MTTTIPGYRLRPVGPAQQDPARFVGTREADGARVAVIVTGSDRVTDTRPEYLGARAPHVLPVDAFVDLGERVAVVYADPPRHTLAELAERGPMSAGAVAYAVLRCADALGELRDAGLRHPPVDPQTVWVTAGGELVLGDLGVTTADGGADGPVAQALALGRALLADVTSATSGVARLGLDADEADRRALAHAFTDMGAADAGADHVGAAEMGAADVGAADMGAADVGGDDVGGDGVAIDATELASRVTALVAPHRPTLPRDWEHDDRDLASRLRALAREAQPAPTTRRRWLPGSLSIPRRRRGMSAGVGRRRHAVGSEIAESRPGHVVDRAGDARGRGPGRRPGEALTASWGWVLDHPASYAPLALVLLVVSALVTTTILGARAAATARDAAMPSATAVVPGGAAQVSSGVATDRSRATAPDEREAAPTDPPSRATPQPNAAAPQPLRDRDALPVQAREVVQALCDLRARSWRELDDALIDLLDAPDSPAYRQDVVALERARSGGLRYRGLEFRVRSAREVRRTADVVTIEARISTSAFTISSASGELTDVGAAPTGVVRLALRWSGSRWQVAQAPVDPA